ncbi:hypothetical protein AVEN_98404-1 [Araneus ventricosus]|uniref:Uncharacterized protein n=1 Tax=Araneus ventricosus TaxID=182803 RepID=A0A4Y2I3N7_ARAVE|nr:hypothetical protein AVEN_98404-1 [Araneus ventricosus]
MSKTRFNRRRQTLEFNVTRSITHTISLSFTEFICPYYYTLQIPQAFRKNTKTDREDILHQKQTENPDIDLHYIPQIDNETLILLEYKWLSICGKTLFQLGLPVPTRQAHHTLDRDLL